MAWLLVLITPQNNNNNNTRRRRSIITALVLTGFFLTNAFTIKRTATVTTAVARTTAASSTAWASAADTVPGDISDDDDDDTDNNNAAATTASTSTIQEAPYFVNGYDDDDDLYFAHPSVESKSHYLKQHHTSETSPNNESSRANVNLPPHEQQQNQQQQQQQQQQERFHDNSPKRILQEVLSSEEEEGSSSSTSSRREWLQRVAAVSIGGVLIGGGTLSNTVEKQLQLSTMKQQQQRLAPINLTAVAKETDVNVTLECSLSCVSLDTTTFQKKRSIKLPAWFPPYLVPEPKVIRDIPNTEVAAAAIIAGSWVEMTRTLLLYPLLTLKNRIQNDVNHRYKTRNKKLHLLRRLKILQLTAKRHIDEGNLYAGVLPLLAVAAPATGVYYGTRDLTKRMIAIFTPLSLSGVETAVLCAFVADVVSLMIRTPADALAIRLQIATGEESHLHDHDHHGDDNNNDNYPTVSNTSDESNNTEDDESEAEAIIEAKVGNWFIESIERLPAVILTDLPYLLSRIVIKKAFLNGEIDIGRYELAAISIALLCAFLTTPFDVARTRILVDSDDDPNTGIDGGSGEGLIKTMKTIMNEGDGGIGNLFAGWFERTLYLGVGRAWLEPFQLVGYTAIRDSILLEAFD